MKRVVSFLILLLFCCGPAMTQQPAPSQTKPANPQPKVVDAFLDFLTEKIHLGPQERKKMRPLIVGYFAETKRIASTTTDPLQRDQERAALKISYRRSFTPVIGAERATQFFTEEQLFRKKIKEELKHRNVKEN
ncbi:MAG: hypothetical protein J7539_11795 [Niabella sp.]|nr:hypothetical protein [Niabella sp.]